MHGVTQSVISELMWTSRAYAFIAKSSRCASDALQRARLVTVLWEFQPE
jgi:hypothetical protein